MHDCFTIAEILMYEALGFAAPGQGAALAKSGATALDGALPTNPDGGCLSYAWNGTQQMTLKLIECVRQFRGTTVHQLADVEVALAANAGSAASHYELAILGKGSR